MKKIIIITTVVAAALAYATPLTAANTLSQCRAQASRAHTLEQWRSINQKCKRIEARTTRRAFVIKHTNRCAKQTPITRIVCEALIQATLDREIPVKWAYNKYTVELLRRESTWNPNAINDSSHACGLFQFLPCRWNYSGAGTRHENVEASVREQAQAGWLYIAIRYGSPANAVAFHNKNNWY